MESQAINTSLKDRISAFAKASQLLDAYLNTSTDMDLEVNEFIASSIHLAQVKNPWFDRDNITYALKGWASLLSESSLTAWMFAYDSWNETPKNIGVITAGNLPLVGFHDVLSVILVGHFAQIKSSSNDSVLIRLILNLAERSDVRIANSYSFVESKLSGFDAVIATGSDNTARYFEHYFGRVPNIIRKNRNSVAILTGDETPEEMKALSHDVFMYYGLGCRSVSHIMVPQGYNFDAFFNGMYEQRHLIKNEKYLNNYDYNKAVYLMSEFELLDNEFLIIKEETNSYSSPIASLGYQFYENRKDAVQKLRNDHAVLQCVVCSQKNIDEIAASFKDLNAPQVLPFGQTQSPGLTDYADGIDTIDFLLKSF